MKEVRSKTKGVSRKGRREIGCICTGLLIALLIVLMGIWPQTAQAQPACIITQITHTTVGNKFGTSINAAGTRIAFGDDIDGNNEIFLWDERTGIRQITNTSGAFNHNVGPSINAAGTRIAFEFETFTDNEIFLWDERTGIRQITNSISVSNRPSINADGRLIAFESNRDGNFEIFLWDERTGITRQITNTPVGITNFLPSINADGTRIAFVSDRDGNREIFLFDTTTNKLTQITHTVGITNESPSINADGTSIAFESVRDGFFSEVFLWDARTGIRQITNSINPADHSPSINAAGTRIAFVSANNSTPDGNPDISVLDTATNELTQVTNTPAGIFNSYFGTSINAAGTRISFVSDRDGNREIFLAECVTLLVYIPGIAASRLDDADEVKVEDRNIWPVHMFRANRLRKLTLDPSRAREQGNIFVSDIFRIDEIDVPSWFDQDVEIHKPMLDMLIDPFRGGYREYQAMGNPARLTTAGCDLSQKPSNPTLFVFPYDWRKSNVESATALKDYIGCIQQFYPNSKIDILIHSNGGLVARRYIIDNPGTHNVDRLVTIGTPWLGASKAIYVLETGEFTKDVHKLFDDDAEPVLKENKALAEFFPNVHHLLPSRLFFSFASAFREEGLDINNNGIAFEEYSYDQFVNLLNQRFRSSPGTTGRLFHDNPGQDDWRNDNSGIQYLHIVGVKKNADTIGAVIPRNHISCDEDSPSCVTSTVFIIQKTAGDGTVPVFSAARKTIDCNSMSPPGGTDLNAPGATVKVFCNLPKVGDEEGSEHTALTKSKAVHDLILAFLGRGVTRQASAVQTAVVSQAEQEPSPLVEPAFYLMVIGATGVKVTDAFGNSTGEPSDTPTLSTVPGVTTYITGEDSRLIIMDPDLEYTVTFGSGSDPIALEITKGTDVTTTMAIRYQDLNLPAGVEAMLKINPDAPDGIERLKFDSDGDGTFETEVAPTVEVEGADAEDVAPPTIDMSARVVQPTITHVTLTAIDNDSGVKDIFFSLDGTNFSPYTGTLSLDPTRTPVIHAFADDNVGNRSSPVTFQIPSAPVTCGGRTATIVGTPGNNVINGTSGLDVIHGLGGDDIINGFDGNDVICGGSGNDTISGDNGNDRLLGQNGNDILRGKGGNDRMNGNFGNDSCDGGLPNNPNTGDTQEQCETVTNVP